MRITNLVFVVFVSSGAASAQNCARSYTHWPPLNDLGLGRWQGRDGGLYPNGMNERPWTHDSAGMALAATVVPLDTAGVPDSNGKIVLLTMGMSGVSQETNAFFSLARQLPNVNQKLLLINGADSGSELRSMANANDVSWRAMQRVLQDSGSSGRQVQVVWMQQTVGNPTDSDYQHTIALFDSLMIPVLHTLRGTFPNLKLCFVSSNVYGGYATIPLCPEPNSYNEGYALREIISRQIAGDSALRYSGANPRAPWLAWGPYVWGDGSMKRVDSLAWICPDDFLSDGAHLSQNGAAKVAHLLVAHFATDATCAPWFLVPMPRDSDAMSMRYFPLHIGDRWTFLCQNSVSLGPGDTSFYVTMICSDTVIDGKHYRSGPVTGRWGSPWAGTEWFRTNGVDSIWTPGDQRYATFSDLHVGLSVSSFDSASGWGFGQCGSTKITSVGTGRAPFGTWWTHNVDFVTSVCIFTVESRTFDERFGLINMENDVSEANEVQYYLLKGGILAGEPYGLQVGVDALSTQLPIPYSTLSITPNPVRHYDDGIVSISSAQAFSSILVSDILGRTVKTICFRPHVNRAMIPTSEFSGGVYFLHALGTGTSATGSIVVQH